MAGCQSPLQVDRTLVVQTLTSFPSWSSPPRSITTIIQDACYRHRKRRRGRGRASIREGRMAQAT